MKKVEYSDAVLSLDDDVFIDCISDLEKLINQDWEAEKIDTDKRTNTSWVTLKRENNLKATAN